MSTLKKILALTLALAMVLSLNVFAAFNDQAEIDEDCVSAMQLMEDLGILKGDDKGNANPTKTITRAEVAAMIFRLMNKGNDDNKAYYVGMNKFSDVKAGSWYEGYVNFCADMGYVQGYPSGIFDPGKTVTGYEAMKMLLTCLRYKSDVEGYTGANWTSNVLADAFEIELSDGYGLPFAAPAERQWVALLFENALNQELVKYEDGMATGTGKELGADRMGLSYFTGVVYALDKATLDSDYTAKAGTVVVDDGEDEKTFTVAADTALLGQQVTVTYAEKNAKVSKVYSVRATSNNTVGTAVMADVEVDDDGKYIVGDIKMALETETAAEIFVNDTACALVDGTELLASEMGDPSAIKVIAIDNDDNDKIDYIIMTRSLYGAADVNAKTEKADLTTGITGKDYDVINGIDKIADKDIVKVTANPFTQMYDVEKLDSNVAKLYSKAYKLGNNTYKVSNDAISATASNLNGITLGNNAEFYLADGYIVYAAEPDTTSTTGLPTFVLVTDTAKPNVVSDDPFEAVQTVKLFKALGLDGKVTSYEFDCEGNASAVTAAFEAVVTAVADDKAKVYELIDNGDGTFDLKAPAENAQSTTSTTEKDVAYSTTGGYDKDYIYAEGSGTTAGENAMQLDIDAGRLNTAIRVGSDVKMFMGYKNSAEKTVYSVVTLADLKKDQAFEAEKSFFYTYTNRGISYLAFAFFGGNFDAAEVEMDYAIVTTSAYDEYDETDDEIYTKVDLVYADGTEAKGVIMGLASAVDHTAYTAKHLFDVVINSKGYADLTPVAYSSETDETGDVDAIDVDIVKLGENTARDLNKDCVFVLIDATNSNAMSFVTIEDIIAIYDDVKDTDHTNYDGLEAFAKKNSKNEYTLVVFTASMTPASN